MSDRGSYRSIHTVLIDGPDYQALSPAAKLVFLTLKLNLGPCGIDVLYPSVLEDQTGLPSDRVTGALDALVQSGWIRRDRNVIWIVDGLRYEPSRKLSNPNHVKDVIAHLKALPHLAIVDAFRAHYGLTNEAPPSRPNAMADAMEMPSPITEDGRQKTEQRKTPRKTAARGDSKERFALEPYINAHRTAFPGSDVPGGRYGRAFKRLEAKHGAVETLRRWVICLAVKGQFATPEELGLHWPNYAQQNGGKPVNFAEAEQAEFRHLCKIVDTRRAKLDGDVWWERMTNDARAPTMADLYRYAAKHLEDPAYDYVPNN